MKLADETIISTLWCPECGGPREIIEEFEDAILERGGWRDTRVWRLACGHTPFDRQRGFTPLPW